MLRPRLCVPHWRKVRPGGILAGHDYCNHGEPGLGCTGCADVPLCKPYTRYGIARGKPKGKRAANQNEVVRAVQEWLVEQQQLQLRLHHTLENFTRASLAADGFSFDLIVTMTRNPSWFILKP